MALTYNDFLKEAEKAGLSGQFSIYDLNTAKKNPEFGFSMLSYKQDYTNAADQAAKNAANQGAEALRKQYGSYLGGSDGSKYYGLGPSPGSYQSSYQSQIGEVLDKMNSYGSFSYDAEKPSYTNAYQDKINDLLGRMESYGDFSYAEAPVYTNRYQQQIDDLLGQVQNYGEFSWSKEEDPAYAAYAKQYRREGDRATQQALAQAAAMTGGQVSSAAMTAAGQAGDYYAGQLADVIPELYNAAYNRYVSDYGILTDKLGQTQQAEQMDYNKYLNELGQYNTDRAQSYDQWLQGYNMLGSSLGAYQSQEQADYSKYLSELGQYNTDRAQAYDQYLQGYNMLGSNLSALQGQDQTEYNRLLDQVDFNRDLDAQAREEAIRQETLAAEQQALAQAQVDAMLQAGAMPSSGLIGQSGYAGEYVQAMDNWYKQQAAAARGSGSGSSGGSRSGSSSGGDSGGNVSDNVYQWLADSGAKDYGTAYQMLRAAGYGVTDSETYAKYYVNSVMGSEETAEAASGGSEAASNALEVDMDSVLALGYGPVSEDRLSGLVDSGQVEEYVEGNKIKFRRAANTGSLSYADILAGIQGGFKPLR